MTASKAFQKEQVLRKSISGDQVFIKLEIADSKGQRSIHCGLFIKENKTHYEAKALARFMITNDAITQ